MKPRILIIDDQEELLNLLKEYLTTVGGYEVHAATNGKRGLELFAEHRFNLILLDLFMPVKDGSSTLERFRTVNPLIPILVMTGNADQLNDSERGMIQGVLEKPFMPSQVLKRVQEFLPQSAPEAV
jgi:CheY-like chemotaxis protein